MWNENQKNVVETFPTDLNWSNTHRLAEDKDRDIKSGEE